jgi:hypothetical protein
MRRVVVIGAALAMCLAAGSASVLSFTPSASQAAVASSLLKVVSEHVNQGMSMRRGNVLYSAFS